MKKVFASIWHNSPLQKWKLDEAIVVEDEKITNWASGGTFFFGPARVKKGVLEEALLDLLFFDPEKYEDYEDQEWQKEFERIKKEYPVEFISSEEIEKLRKKYPEAEPEVESEEEEI